jgi:hypothetical protein
MLGSQGESSAFGDQCIPSATEPGRACLGGGKSARLSPASPGPFEAQPGDLFAGTFDGATADKVALLAKAGIIHACLVVGKVGDCFVNSGGGLRRELLAGIDQLVDLTFPQQGACIFEPGLRGLRIQAKSGFGNRGQIGTGMIPVNDLHRLREVPCDQVPDPDGSITDKDQFFIEISLPLTGTGLKEITELVAGFEVTGIADLLCL